MQIPKLQGKNFILRPYQNGDQSSLRKHISNIMIYRNTTHIPYPYTRKDADQWITKNLKEQKQKAPQSINFAITVKDKVVGGISLSNIKPQHKGEIGYWLGEQFWGQGIMTEAVNLVTQFGFKRLKLKRIFACVYPSNRASMRVLEKAGFDFEGVFKKHVKKGRRYIDGHIYAQVK